MWNLCCSYHIKEEMEPSLLLSLLKFMNDAILFLKYLWSTCPSLVWYIYNMSTCSCVFLHAQFVVCTACVVRLLYTCSVYSIMHTCAISLLFVHTSCGLPVASTLHYSVQLCWIHPPIYMRGFALSLHSAFSLPLPFFFLLSLSPSLPLSLFLSLPPSLPPSLSPSFPPSLPLFQDREQARGHNFGRTEWVHCQVLWSLWKWVCQLLHNRTVHTKHNLYTIFVC